MKQNDLTPARIAVGLYLKRQIDALENDYVADDLTDFAKRLAQQVAKDLLEGEVDVKTTPHMIEQAKTVIIETHNDQVIPAAVETQKTVIAPKPTRPSDQVTKPNFAEMLKPKHKEPVC